MFENAQERNGKIQVPIFFTLNGKKMIIRDGGEQVFMDSNKPLYPYIGMTDGCSVLAKVWNQGRKIHGRYFGSERSETPVWLWLWLQWDSSLTQEKKVHDISRQPSILPKIANSNETLLYTVVNV